MATDDDVQRLSDIEAIKVLRARYTRAIDTKDWDLYGDSLAEDAHLSTERGEDHGREHIVEVISQALTTATTVHHVHTPEIELTGPDTASGIWAMNDLVDFPTFAIRGWGHYEETYVRTDDGWKIQSSTLRRLRVDTEGELPSR
jgi:uncharacterized protein (TIGR02246 family)